MLCAALNTGPNTHLDHLGVLAALFKIPLIISDEKTFELAQKYYPFASSCFKDLSELSLGYLATFDVLFECGKFWTIDLLPLIELLFHKKMRLVFCPHGNSDKGYSFIHENSGIQQDIALIYGDHMLDLLTKTKALGNIRHLVRTGNYRLHFYLEHKEFYDSCLQEKLSKRLDPRKKTILYAPTWQDKENPSSFFVACKKLVEQLDHSFNMIIKLHPLLEETHPGQVIHTIAALEQTPHVCFLSDFPPIYPLLNYSDVYLGDFSSIGYDFLAFDKPMFFLNPSKSAAKGNFLHCCGQEIPLDEKSNPIEFLEKNLSFNQRHFSPLRKEIYEFAFGQKREADVVFKEICSLVLEKKEDANH